MMIAQNIKNKGIYLGYFTYVDGFDSNDNPMKCLNFSGSFRWSEYVNMGDMVYGMYINDQLVKIGMTTDKKGWAGRSSTYCNKSPYERTNKMFRRVLSERFNLDEVKIEVYGIQTRRETIEHFDPITNTILTVTVSMARDIEKQWTDIAKNQGEDLYLCTQN